jgi:hypothetical protein
LSKRCSTPVSLAKRFVVMNKIAFEEHYTT